MASVYSVSHTTPFPHEPIFAGMSVAGVGAPLAMQNIVGAFLFPLQLHTPQVSSTKSQPLGALQRDFVVEQGLRVNGHDPKVWDFVEGYYGVAVQCASDPCL